MSKHAKIICVMDKSGSMDSIKESVISGYNKFLKDQKEVPGKADMTLVLFNHTYELVYKDEDIQNVPELDESTYRPNGTTALLDAVGRTIDDIDKEVESLSKSKIPNKYIMAIITDGEENASRDYKHERINKIINDKKKEGWEILFLAANQDAIKVGTSIGIQPQSCVNYNATHEGTQVMYTSYSAAVRSMRTDK